MRDMPALLTALCLLTTDAEALRLQRERAGWATGIIAAAAAGTAVLLFAVGRTESDIRDKEYRTYVDAAYTKDEAARYAAVTNAVNVHNTLVALGWSFAALAAASIPVSLVLFATSKKPVLTATAGPGALFLRGSF
jgi:hypothetical protein